MQTTSNGRFCISLSIFVYFRFVRFFFLFLISNAHFVRFINIDKSVCDCLFNARMKHTRFSSLGGYTQVRTKRFCAKQASLFLRAKSIFLGRRFSAVFQILIENRHGNRKLPIVNVDDDFYPFSQCVVYRKTADVKQTISNNSFFNPLKLN